MTNDSMSLRGYKPWGKNRWGKSLATVIEMHDDGIEGVGGRTCCGCCWA